MTEIIGENHENQLINIEIKTEVSKSVSELIENPVVSKRQRKKLAKLEQWEEKKKLKRLKEREKYRERRRNGELKSTGPSRKALKHNKIDLSSNPHTIAIDLAFDDLMIDKDICKCAKQLLWVYTINRKSKQPIHLHYTGLKEGSRLQIALNRNDGYTNWDVRMNIDSYLNIFPKEKIVYLTSDSDTVLIQLDSNDVYIIGGLIDHNHHKGLTLQRATEAGLRTARLPLSEHLSMKTRTVLTIVHVFDILLRVSQGMGWKEAMLEVLPQRKGARPLPDNGSNLSDVSD